MSKATSKSKSKAPKVILFILTVLSLLALLFFLFARIIVRTSDLPQSCHSLLTVSQDCKQDVIALARNADQRRCYDNFDYVDCLGIAQDATEANRGIVLALVAILVFGISLLLVKSKSNSK